MGGGAPCVVDLFLRRLRVAAELVGPVATTVPLSRYIFLPCYLNGELEFVQTQQYDGCYGQDQQQCGASQSVHACSGDVHRPVQTFVLFVDRKFLPLGFGPCVQDVGDC